MSAMSTTSWTVWTVWWHVGAWSFDADVWIGTAAIAAAYGYGRRRLILARGPKAAPVSRAWFMYLGLALQWFALQSPIAWLAGRLLSAHMLHHMLLLVVAAPLIAAATPWAAFRFALPPSGRAELDRFGAAADGTGPIGRIAAVLASPITAVVAFVGTLWLWHLPAAYDLTLRSPFVHEVEHAMFLATGILFWSHAVGTSWLAARLSPGRRILLISCGMAGSWFLSLILAFQPAAIYAPYLFTVHLVSGLTPLDDQRIAAGLMWAVGMIPFNLAIAMAIKRVMDAEDEAVAAPEMRAERA